MNVKRVWKWTLFARDVSTISVPAGTEFLTVHEQQGGMCIWGLVDPAEPRREERTFRIVGTGHNLSNGEFRYLGSVHLEGGALVFHVFEAI